MHEEIIDEIPVDPDAHLTPKEKKKISSDEKKKIREADEKALAVYIPVKSLATLSTGDMVEDTLIDPDSIGKAYRVGAVTTYPIKVIGYNLVEGRVVATNLPSVVNDKISHQTDIAVGQVLKCEVTEIRDFGLIVKIGRNVSAVCPAFHCADTSIKESLRKKFKVGTQLKMRVWENDNGAIIMTNKKSIVELSDPVLHMNEVAVGVAMTGIVTKISKEGMTVRYFNKIRGIIPMTVLNKQNVLNPVEEFAIGQVVRTVVVRKEMTSSTRKNKKEKSTVVSTETIYLALDIGNKSTILTLMDDVPIAKAKQSVSKDKNYAIETNMATSSPTDHFVCGTIFKIEKDTMFIRAEDGRVGRLHKHQLFDFADTADSVFSASNNPFVIGYKVNCALILSKNEKDTLMITCKPLLMSIAARNADKEGLLTEREKNYLEQAEIDLSENDTEPISIPKAVSDMSPGQIIAGYVMKVAATGVIVKFFDNLAAIAPRPNLMDKFVSTPVGLFNLGDSIRCAVQRVDLAGEKAIITLKSSIVTPSGGLNAYWNRYFRELFVAHKIATNGEDLPNWQKYAIGNSVKAILENTGENYSVLTSKDGSARFKSVTPIKAAVGEIVSVRVIDVLFVKTKSGDNIQNEVIFMVDLNEKGKKDKQEIFVDSVVSAKIIYIGKNYLVVRLGKKVCHVMVADYHKPNPEMNEFKLNHDIKIKITKVPQDVNESEEPVAGSFPHQNICHGVLFTDQNDRRAQLAKLEREGKEQNGTDMEMNPEDSRQKFIESLRVGHLCQWVITEIKDREVLVQPVNAKSLDMDMRAVIPLCFAVNRNECWDQIEDLKRKNFNSEDKHPFHGMEIDQKIWCHVAQVRRNTVANAKDNFLIYLSLASFSSEKDDFAAFRPMPQPHGKDNIKCPGVYTAVVVRTEDTCCTVAITPYISSKLSYLDISNDVETIKVFKDKCYVGLKVVIAVVHMSKENNNIKHITISRKAIEKAIPKKKSLSYEDANQKELLSEIVTSSEDLSEGDIVHGILNLKNSIAKPPAFSVSLSNNKFGRLCATELLECDKWVDLSPYFLENNSNLKLPNGMKHGDIISCLILQKGLKGIELSTRQSRMVCISVFKMSSVADLAYVNRM